MTDVIQQAREALDAYMTNWRVEKERDLRGTVLGALRALLAASDAGHLIDVRSLPDDVQKIIAAEREAS